MGAQELECKDFQPCAEEHTHGLGNIAEGEKVGEEDDHAAAAVFPKAAFDACFHGHIPARGDVFAECEQLADGGASTRGGQAADVVGTIELPAAHVFTAVQATAAHALGEAFDELLESVMDAYPGRRRLMVEALKTAGFEVFESAATFYVWCKVPQGESSVDFCNRALDEIGIVVTPGTGFGTGGEGWFRISLTASDEDIAEGARRIGAWQ